MTKERQQLIIVFTSHWLTLAGVALTTLAALSWLFALPVHIRGHVDNPYIGLLVFILIPAVFFTGLVLIPIGVALGKSRIGAAFPEASARRLAWRKLGVFVAVMTLANIIIASQLTYRAVEHMETVQFCGQTCHVMKPEFIGHSHPPHQQVECVACHVAPGASGWLESKMAGTRQLVEVMFNSYPRPIESAIESNRIAPSAVTCERCHARQMPVGLRLKVLSKFKDDEANTRTETVLVMRVGGGHEGGIHGAHLGPGVRIRYAAGDKRRETIPWVEYRAANGAVRTYFAADAKLEAIQSLPVFEMQCIDCHNRAAHAFETADRALDRALAAGELPSDLPWLKKLGLSLIQTRYQTDAEAAREIPSRLGAFYRDKYPAISSSRARAIRSAGEKLAQIYNANVFPDLKVTWGTYPNNLGHTDAPGCFRCHDENHVSPDKKTISQGCNACHQTLAVEETSPAVLKTLGLEQ
jgi:hypothetical protein